MYSGQHVGNLQKAFEQKTLTQLPVDLRHDVREVTSINTPKYCKTNDSQYSKTLPLSLLKCSLSEKSRLLHLSVFSCLSSYHTPDSLLSDDSCGAIYIYSAYENHVNKEHFSKRLDKCNVVVSK